MPGQPLITCRGQGPELVLVHGWGLNTDCWGELAGALADTHRLHLVELPGHGAAKSGRWRAGPLVDSILAQTPPAAWLGWSLGGLLALEAARRRPDRVSRLLLVGTNPCFVASDDWPDGISRSSFRALRRSLSLDARALLDEFYRLMTAGCQAEHDGLARLRALAGVTPGTAELMAGLDALEHLDLRAALPGLGQPALWLHGGADQVAPPEAARKAAGCMPRGRFRVIGGAAHAPMLSHPGVVLDCVRSFLAEAVAA